jgi:alpha-galactosidase
MTTFTDVSELAVDAGAARVYEHGWQSWTPTTTYRLGDQPFRLNDPTWFAPHYLSGGPAPAGQFAGGGLLAVDPGTGEGVRIWAAADPTVRVPEIRAAMRDGRLLISADGPVREFRGAPGADLDAALALWAIGYATPLRGGPIRPAPTIWCSWYHYFTDVSESDIAENLDAIDKLDLPVDVVQIDDGYEAELGDWLTLSNRFASLSDLVARIRDRGRRAGIWVAPFLVGERSATFARHSEWLVRSADGTGPLFGCHNWNQDLYVPDVTNAAVVDWLTEVFSTLAGMGIDFFKIDFIYAGALEGRRQQDISGAAAYRQGVALIRDAVGPDAYLLGCGAPILSSIGLVDGMRISPDIASHYDPPDGDLSMPSQRAAVLNGAARAFQHGRWWVNDPDCLVARPAIERRQEWAAHVERFGGLRGSSDRLADLDDWGLETTRRVLAEVPPPVPFAQPRPERSP